MKYALSNLCILVALGLALTACGKASSPASPPIETPESPKISGETNHYLLGYNLIAINQATETWEVLPSRNPTDHWNILAFLEQAPCFNCFNITGFQFNPDGVHFIDIEVRHPFSSNTLTMFDVRTIIMFNGSLYFPENGLVVSDSRLGDGEVMNAEGYTNLYNAFTWGSGFGGYQGYIPGKFSTPTMPNATLNGYRRYISIFAGNTRNAFVTGSAITRTFHLRFPEADEFVLGYAVDASWVPPLKEPVTDPIADFPIEANCAEPWKIVISDPIPLNGLTIHGGSVKYNIEIYDWQGSATLREPAIECLEVFDGLATGLLVSDSGNYSTWEIVVENEKLVGLGTYPALLKVEDISNADSPDYLNLTAYQRLDLEIGYGGWARSWGGTDVDIAFGTEVDADGNVYVTGQYKTSVDFDPGEGTETHISNGNADAFLSKFDSSGNFIWTRVWGGHWWESGEDLAIDGSGNIYVVGYFNETVDFDPGDGVVEYSSNGDWDSFLCKFSPDGDFLWARAWGSPMWDKALDVAVDGMGGVYVCGYFRGVCDFDPVDNDCVLQSNPGASYLTKWTESGTHEWAKQWAGDGGYDDIAYGVASDSAGHIFVTGVFDGTVDLDPGGDVTQYTTPTIFNDVYLSGFDSSGNFLWGYAWGEDSDDWGYGVEVDETGYVYATGKFAGTVDFDPGPGVDEWTSNGERDVFLTKFSIGGEYQWTRTWGGKSNNWSNSDSGQDLAVDGKNVYVTGYFNATVDFDPDENSEEEYSSQGDWDIFLNVFDSNGDHVWTRVPGRTLEDSGHDICVDENGNTYMTGRFRDVVDFNPYGGVYNLSSNGLQDCFLVKYLPYGNW